MNNKEAIYYKKNVIKIKRLKNLSLVDIFAFVKILQNAVFYCTI